MRHKEVYFAIPSANPENCRRTLPRWREMGYKTAVLQNRTKAEIPADIVVWSDHYPGWAGSNNILCREIVPDHVQIVVCGGDDMLPDPTLTAQQIADQFLEHFADSPGGTFGVMQPHGDHFLETAEFCGSPWLGRSWFTRMYQGKGGFCDQYRHEYADDELYWVALCRNSLWVRNDLTQRHEHFLRSGSAAPEYWKKTVGDYQIADTAQFVARSAHGFPGHAPTERIAEREFDASIFKRLYNGRAQRQLVEQVDPKFPPIAAIRMSEAFEQCARDGRRRVLIYGTGRHTLRLHRVLQSPQIQVLGFIDDDKARQGTRLWNYPIMSLEEAAKLHPDAVILSSDTVEDQLAQKAVPLAMKGIAIVRLYGQSSHRVREAS